MKKLNILLSLVAISSLSAFDVPTTSTVTTTATNTVTTATTTATTVTTTATNTVTTQSQARVGYTEDYTQVPSIAINAMQNSITHLACPRVSAADNAAALNAAANPNRCFNAVDIVLANPSSIMTKTAGEDFVLKTIKKPTCMVSNITYSLVDDKGNDIAGSTATITSPGANGFLVFNVPNAYKDVKVKFTYDQMIPSTPYQVSCTNIINDPHQYRFRFRFENMNQNELGTYVIPTGTVECYNITNGSVAKVQCSSDPTEYQFQFSFQNMAQNRNGKFALATNYACYRNYTTVHQIEYSTDNFAIKPDRFNITFKKTDVKTGQTDYVSIQTVDTNNNITTNYKNSSITLKPTFSPVVNAQYAFDIYNGEAKNGKVIFNEAKSNVTMTLTDTDYTAVDADDTAQSCRTITGTSNSVNISAPSKYWAGTGTNETQNNPTTNTIQSDVKQNVKKDSHFNKVNW